MGHRAFRLSPYSTRVTKPRVAELLGLVRAKEGQRLPPTLLPVPAQPLPAPPHVFTADRKGIGRRTAPSRRPQERAAKVKEKGKEQRESPRAKARERAARQ